LKGGNNAPLLFDPTQVFFRPQTSEITKLQTWYEGRSNNQLQSFFLRNQSFEILKEQKYESRSCSVLLITGRMQLFRLDILMIFIKSAE